MDHIPETHRVSKPTHSLLCIASLLGISSLIFMGLSQKCQPAEATGLHDGEIKIQGLRLCDPFAFLLNKQAKPQVVKLGHDA